MRPPLSRLAEEYRDDLEAVLAELETEGARYEGAEPVER
jgi:4-hydroxy-tetrahydrodipicolinate synthase